ncbi:MAG: tetratricopeptide repeat protein [Candidatus Omnitrophica bacterium]|nr:tetratricopeptide repeat protein [Candidatus Omnitrophota bacterium]
MPQPSPFEAGFRLLLLIGVGTGLLWFLARRVTPHRGLRSVLIATFSLRAILGVSLYAISYWGWPVLRSLQFSRGFWLFSPDSRMYHYYGWQFAQAWANGTQLPDPVLAPDYFVVVASIYTMLGAHPLYPILLNAWLAAATGLLAFVLARDVFGPRTAIVTAALVSAWPSTFIWSAQLLKDSVTWCLVFSALVLVVRIVRAAKHHEGRGAGRLSARYLGLAVSVLFLTRFRFYLGSAFLLGAIIVALPAAGLALRRRQMARALAYGGLVTVVALSTIFARTLPVLALVSPAHPERGHFRLAESYYAQGNLERAEHHLSRAVSLDPTSREAALGLAAVQVQRQRFPQALEIYKQYLHQGDPTEQAVIRKIIVQIYLDRATVNADAEYWEGVAAAYQQILELEPTLLPIHLEYSMALAQLRRFEKAKDALAHAKLLIRTPEEQAEYSAAIDRMVQIYLDRAKANTDGAYWEGVAAAYQQILELEPTLLPIHLEYSMALAQLRRFEKAQAALERAKPLIHTSEEQADFAAAQAELQALLKGKPRRWIRKRSIMPAVLPKSSGMSVNPEELLSLALSLFPRTGGALRLRLSRESGRGFSMLSHSVSQMDEQAIATIRETSPEALAVRREGFVSSGGYSLTDAWAKISSPRKLITYLPRAMAIGFLAPFPWQWFDLRGSTGIMRVFAGLEMLGFYLLIPGLIRGVSRLASLRRVEALFLLAVIASIAAPVSLVVANMGTLFRLRLLFLLPLLLIAAHGDPIEIYRRIFRRPPALPEGSPHEHRQAGALEDALSGGVK